MFNFVVSKEPLLNSLTSRFAPRFSQQPKEPKKEPELSKPEPQELVATNLPESTELSSQSQNQFGNNVESTPKMQYIEHPEFPESSDNLGATAEFSSLYDSGSPIKTASFGEGAEKEFPEESFMSDRCSNFGESQPLPTLESIPAAEQYGNTITSQEFCQYSTSVTSDENSYEQEPIYDNLPLAPSYGNQVQHYQCPSELSTSYFSQSDYAFCLDEIPTYSEDQSAQKSQLTSEKPPENSSSG